MNQFPQIRTLRRLFYCCLCGLSFASHGYSSSPDSIEVQGKRIGISGGMGVSYLRATDIVDRINATSITQERVSDFTASAEFFGAVSVPLNKDWIIKAEYAYLITSYNVPTQFQGSEFCITSHLPTIVAQYVLVDQGVYNVKGGFGLGYHFGSYVEHFGSADNKFTGSGPGAKLDFEANTAFGESFYAYIGGDIRMDFIGDLSDSDNPNETTGITPTLNFFSIGAKLGFTFYL